MRVCITFFSFPLVRALFGPVPQRLLAFHPSPSRHRLAAHSLQGERNASTALNDHWRIIESESGSRVFYCAARNKGARVRESFVIRVFFHKTSRNPLTGHCSLTVGFSSAAITPLLNEATEQWILKELHCCLETRAGTSRSARRQLHCSTLRRFTDACLWICLWKLKS